MVASGRPTRQGESLREMGDARFLTQTLADGPVDSKRLLSMGVTAGYSHDSIWAAKKTLPVRVKKTGFGGGWSWELLSAEGLGPGEGQGAEESKPP